MPSDHLTRRLSLGGAAVRPPHTLHRAAYLPEEQYAAAWDQHLLDATNPRAHDDYRWELEHSLRAIDQQQPSTRIQVVPLDVAGLVAFAQREGEDPASRQTRLAYTDFLHGTGRDVDWPPQRNALCWCGSARKYKKCCGDPGFLATTRPDPASLVLKVELDHVDPPVWRRIAVPSNTTLDRVHHMVQAAMGWNDEHLYAFETDDDVFTDPRSGGSGLSAERERLVSLVSEPGQRFWYRYDFGDDWLHTVTLEQVRDGGQANTFTILDGAGACPSEDCGGPVGYLNLLQALGQPDHPDHDDAVDRLGEDYDPARYPPPGDGRSADGDAGGP
jgi:uncharacterized protein YchJ